MAVTLPRWLRFTLVACATAMLILGAAGLISLGLKADWLAYYAAGRFLLNGNIAQVYDLPILQAWQAQYIGQNITPFLYAPVYSVPFMLLALLSPWSARIAWLLIGLAAGFAAAKISTRWSGLSFPWSVVALLAFPPFAYSLAVGQISPLTLLIFSGVVALEWGGMQGYAAGLLAGLAFYKPQLLIPLAMYWLLARRWRSLLGLGLAGVLVLGISYVVDSRSLSAYIQLSQQFFKMAENSSNSGANIALFGISPALGYGITAIVLLTLGLAALRGKNGRYFESMLWLAPVLVAPYLVIYDMLLVALPISLLSVHLRKDRLAQAAVILVWLMGFLAPIILSTRPVTWAVLLLYAVCAWRVFKPLE